MADPEEIREILDECKEDEHQDELTAGQAPAVTSSLSSNVCPSLRIAFWSDRRAPTLAP